MPLRLLVLRELRPRIRAYIRNQRDTSESTHSIVRLVRLPKVDGMVPVRPLWYRLLRAQGIKERVGRNRNPAHRQRARTAKPIASDCPAKAEWCRPGHCCSNPCKCGKAIAELGAEEKRGAKSRTHSVVRLVRLPNEDGIVPLRLPL